MFEQFTEYLTGWQICQLPLSFEGSKLFSFRGASPLTPWAPLGAPPPDLRYNPLPLTANPLASPRILMASTDDDIDDDDVDDDDVSSSLDS